ncbi:CXXC-rich [Entamoeba marina]
MLFILTLFFVFTLSDDWTEIDSIIQISSDSGNVVGWTQEYKELEVSGQSEDCYYFYSDCCSSVNMQMEDFAASGKSRENLYFDSATPSNLLSFNLRSSHDGTKNGDYYTGRHRVYLQYVPDYFVFMEGCFGSATGCRSSIINDVGTEYHIYLISVILYFQINSQTKIHFHNEKSSRYLYVDGIASQDVTTYLQYTPTQTGYYLMTGKNINSLTMANTSYSIQSVCSRNEVNRYYLYSSTESSTNNCGCMLTSGTTISSTGVFDHPDCVRNNTYFDLDLSTLSSTTITFNGSNTWYSLLFPTTLTITNSESVVITDLVLESGHTVEFSGDVEVTNLEINSVGDYVFNSISFTTSSLSEGIDDDDILFKQTSINNDLYDSNGIKKCGTRYVKSESVNRCTCVKNGDSYDDGIGGSFTDCLSYKSFSNNILNLKVSSSYETFSTEYWNILYFNTVTSTLTASSGSLIFTTCNFTSVNVTIDVSSSINELDVNVLFNGLFVLDENVVLMMNSSIKSNSFAITSDNAIVYISDVLDELILTISTTNKLLLIGNGVGFSQQQLTAKTSTQTTTVSNDSLCNSLLYSLDGNECILCDGLVDQYGYCFNETSETIYKCISKTEFGCEECYEEITDFTYLVSVVNLLGYDVELERPGRIARQYQNFKLASLRRRDGHVIKLGYTISPTNFEKLVTFINSHSSYKIVPKQKRSDSKFLTIGSITKDNKVVDNQLEYNIAVYGERFNTRIKDLMEYSALVTIPSCSPLFNELSYYIDDVCVNIVDPQSGDAQSVYSTMSSSNSFDNQPTFSLILPDYVNNVYYDLAQERDLWMF